jgi:hypothetical protein
MASEANEHARVALEFTYIADAILQRNSGYMRIFQLSHVVDSSADQCAGGSNLFCGSKMLAEASVHRRLYPRRISCVPIELDFLRGVFLFV